jgi:crotonobetainyl-CoA:carnitine CoA-transferase CaiB-like acyl-CoA transferase
MVSATPLSGIRVLDLGHTVMGPSAGLMLADLGAEVIRIEPAPDGDPTRFLKGFGTGYFGFFNRNKQSLAIDLKTPEGHRIALDLVRSADVLIENFAPGTMERLRLGPETLLAENPRLIYASLKGFLKGPYENRLALDEVVQMMAGLAFMTGPSGRPLRAGTSVVDITGGMFAVIGILAALRERDRSGAGTIVETALFETCVFLMGQHLCYSAQSDDLVPPMPERVSAWAVYELFQLADGQQFFLGITTDAHWQRFCAAVGRPDLAADSSLATNNLRIAARPRIIPIMKDIMASLTAAEAARICEKARVPFAPIARPEDLFSDTHLRATGGLLPTTLPNGITVDLPRLPLRIDGNSMSLRRDPPAVGQDSHSILTALGLRDEEIADLIARGITTATSTDGVASYPEAELVRAPATERSD